MVMSFNNKVKRSLLRDGFIYAVRHVRKIEGIDLAVDEETHKKICVIRISFIKFDKIKNLDLEFYVYHSGYNSVDDWVNRIKNEKGTIYSDWWLYKIERWD